MDGATTSLKDIIKSLPQDDQTVQELMTELQDIGGKLAKVTQETERLNKAAKVTRSVESKRVGGRLTFGCGSAIALLHLKSTTNNTHAQKRS